MDKRSLNDFDAAPSVDAITSAWGWVDPPHSVNELARLSLSARQVPPTQWLVEIGVIRPEELERQLSACPQGVPPLLWLHQNKPDLAGHIEKILTLRSGYPYYTELSVMELHDGMQLDAVAARADEIDAVLMLIEDAVAVIVFASYDNLLEYCSRGREERNADPLLEAAHGGVRFAVAPSNAVHALLQRARRINPEKYEGTAASLWNSADDKESAEARELVRLFDYALDQQVTDISLQPQSDHSLRVLMRKHGSMMRPDVADFYKPDLASRLVNLLMARSGANPSNVRIREPRDGQISYQSNFRRAFMRLSFIPLNHLGDTEDMISVSIRVLLMTESLLSLSLMQVSPANIEQLRFAVQYPQGLILMSGPTNSGKSTTIAACLAEHVKIFGVTRKRLSVEDPVERHIDGVIQINVPQHIQDERRRFGIILPAIKRHDPDVIWVGEIRDAETANLCVAAANSGHLVFSTIHANDSVLAYDVLAKMISPDLRFQLVEAMLLSASQRLARRLCPSCRIPCAPTDTEISDFKRHLEMLGEDAELPPMVARANPDGCEVCQKGYMGMLPINEVLPFTRKVKRACSSAIDNAGNVRDILADCRVTNLLGGLLERVASMEIEVSSIYV